MYVAPGAPCGGAGEEEKGKGGSVGENAMIYPTPVNVVLCAHQSSCRLGAKNINMVLQESPYTLAGLL